MALSFVRKGPHGVGMSDFDFIPVPQLELIDIGINPDIVLLTEPKDIELSSPEKDFIFLNEPKDIDRID